MSFKHIISRENIIFKKLKKLSENSRERRQAGQTLLDGVHLIEAYITNFGAPELLVIPEGKSSLEAIGLMQSLTDDDVSTVMFPTLMFAELTPVASSTGLLALVKIPELFPSETPKFVLMLEDIQDPGNLGAILRSAAAADVDVVYLSMGCTDVWSPKALRGGQGAQFLVPVVERANLLEIAQNFNGKTLATSLGGASLFAQNLTGSVALMVGNEGAGLSAALAEAAHINVAIPMNHKVESLNVTAAATVCLFERVRQMSL